MIKCKICGIERKCSLVHHIKKDHPEISLEDYKEEYGELISEDHRRKISENQKKNWEDDDYRKNISSKMKNKWSDSDFYSKMSSMRKEIYNTNEWKERCKVWFDKYHKEFGSWNKGMTKDDDERIKKTGEINSKKLKGIKKPEHSIKMKHAWAELKNKNPELYKKYNKKRSETISKLISEGRITPKSKNFKTGWYGDSYYASSYELEAMKLFDSFKLNWSNKHVIRLPYIDSEGVERLYIPDFFVKIDNKNYILEMKGDFIYAFDNNIDKKISIAKEMYGDYYSIFFNINDLKEFLDGKCKN